MKIARERFSKGVARETSHEYVSPASTNVLYVISPLSHSTTIRLDQSSQFHVDHTIRLVGKFYSSLVRYRMSARRLECVLLHFLRLDFPFVIKFLNNDREIRVKLIERRDFVSLVSL